MQEIHEFGVDGHFFPHVAITANPKFRKPSGQLEVEIESALSVHPVDGKHDRLFVSLQVKMKCNPETTPYTIDVVCGCHLTTALDTTDDATKEKASRIGYKILFPAIREMVLTITGRQPWGQFSIGIDTDDEIAPPPKTKPKARRVSKKTD